jgi:hypothetical protein
MQCPYKNKLTRRSAMSLKRDICIRNHILGVLLSYSDKGLSYTAISELANSITEAVIEGYSKWKDDNVCEEISS